METLIVIGVGLALVTALSAIVYEMAEARGRHPWAWTIAAFIGLFVVFIGWAVVAATLVLVGPTTEKESADHQQMAAVTHSRT